MSDVFLGGYLFWWISLKNRFIEHLLQISGWIYLQVEQNCECSNCSSAAPSPSQWVTQGQQNTTTATTITTTTMTNIDSLHKCWLFNFVLESVLSFDHSIKLPMEYCRRQNFHGYWAGTRSGRGNSSFFQRKLFIRSKKLFIKPEYLSPGLSKLFMRSQIKGACLLVRGLSVCTH